jgi:molecular chaperone DnaK
VKDAEAHAEEDRQRREEAEIRNNADQLVYQTQKLLNDQGDKLDATERGDVESAVAGVTEALNGTDIEAIKSATERLLTVSQTFSQKLYDAASQADAQAQGSTSADGSQPNEDEIVDAEIVDEQ